MGNSAPFSSAWLASAQVMVFTQKGCKAAMNHSLFVVSHEESPGMWDATSDTRLVSEVLFVVQFKCLREDKHGSSLEGKYCCDGKEQWFSLALSCPFKQSFTNLYKSWGRWQC